MSLLVVGGDRVDARNSDRRLRIYHWSGRKSGDSHRCIPDDTRLVLIFIDYVNHGLAIRVRRMASSRGLPIVFSKWSASSLTRVLRQLDAAPGGAQ